MENEILKQAGVERASYPHRTGTQSGLPWEGDENYEDEAATPLIEVLVPEDLYVKVTESSAYGNILLKPYNPIARMIAELIDRGTVTKRAVDILQKYGFIVEVAV